MNEFYYHKDETKCQENNALNCKNMEMTYSDFDKEKYECKTCGYYYNLYYDDMK